METNKDSVFKCIDVFFENELDLATKSAELSGKVSEYKNGFIDALTGSKDRLKRFIEESLQNGNSNT